MLDWNMAETTDGRRWLSWHQELLHLRYTEIMPRLANIRGNAADFRAFGERGLSVRWRLGDESHLVLLANLGAESISDVDWPGVRVIFTVPDTLAMASLPRVLPAWSVAWCIQEPSSP